MHQEPEEGPEEGARSFTRALEQIADGDLVLDAGEVLHELVKKLSAEARFQHRPIGGSLTLTLKLTVEPHGMVDVVPKLASKVPDRKLSKGVMWVTAGGNLSAQNPRQQKLPLREVGTNEEPARDVGTAAREVREV